MKVKQMNKNIFSIFCIVTLGGASALAQGTTAEKAALEKFSKYEQTGEFTNCINYNMIEKTTIVDDTRIMFELKGNKTVLSTLNNECRNLSFDRQFAYSPNANKVCAKDMISTKRGSCSLGQFETLEEKS